MSIKQTRVALNDLQTFVETCNNTPDNVFSALVTIENTIDSENSDTLKQTNISNFFNNAYLYGLTVCMYVHKYKIYISQ